MRDRRDDGLESFERMPATPNEYRKVSTYHIEDDLVLVAFVFVDFCTLCIEVFEYRLERLDCRVGNLVKLLFGDFVRGFLFLDSRVRVELLFSSILY